MNFSDQIYRLNTLIIASALALTVAACGGGSASNAGDLTSESPAPEPVVDTEPAPEPEPVDIPEPEPEPEPGIAFPPDSPDLPVPPQVPQGPDFLPEDEAWEMVFSSEFNGDSLDRTQWIPEESCWGGGNNELQCYTDREENIQVVNGQLRLIAQKETYTGPHTPPEFTIPGAPAFTTQEYTSGQLRTRTLHDWTYGRFAARMLLPEGQGAWPAFWMFPIDEVYGPWPLSGEIDVMEAVNLTEICPVCPNNEENRIYTTIHFGDPFPLNDQFGGVDALPGDFRPYEEFHVYSVEWAEGRIEWYIDDTRVFVADTDDWFTASTVPQAIGNPNAPFDENFYLRLNLAVGGAFPNAVNLQTFEPESFPDELLVDWVRVYQCDTDPVTGLDCLRP